MEGMDHQAEVGFVVNNRMLPKVKRFKVINDRLCYLEIIHKWYDFINCYAPTENKNENIKNDFYERLDKVCDLLPNSVIKIVLGNLNIKVGQNLS